MGNHSDQLEKIIKEPNVSVNEINNAFERRKIHRPDSEKGICCMISTHTRSRCISPGIPTDSFLYYTIALTRSQTVTLASLHTACW